MSDDLDRYGGICVYGPEAVTKTNFVQFCIDPNRQFGDLIKTGATTSALVPDTMNYIPRPELIFKNVVIESLDDRINYNNFMIRCTKIVNIYDSKGQCIVYDRFKKNNDTLTFYDSNGTEIGSMNLNQVIILPKTKTIDLWDTAGQDQPDGKPVLKGKHEAVASTFSTLIMLDPQRVEQLYHFLNRAIIAKQEKKGSGVPFIFGFYIGKSDLIQDIASFRDGLSDSLENLMDNIEKYHSDKFIMWSNGYTGSFITGAMQSWNTLFKDKPSASYNRFREHFLMNSEWMEAVSDYPQLMHVAGFIATMKHRIMSKS